jgi:predicted DNA-binding transcriptional regulator YafY
MFSNKELATLIVGLNFVKSQADQQLCDDALAVEDKIRQVLPSELKRFMDSLSDRTIVDPFLHFGVEKSEGGNWYQISSAISERKRIEFDYSAVEKKSDRSQKKNENQPNESIHRIVDPYMIVFYKDHWNLIGFSHKRKEVRNFILNRIDNLLIREDRYKEPINFNREAFLFRSGKRTYQVAVEVSENADRQFRANLPTKIIKQEELKPNLFRYDFEFDNLQFLNKWLLQFSDDVRVLKPKALKEERESVLRQLLAQSYTAY